MALKAKLDKVLGRMVQANPPSGRLTFLDPFLGELRMVLGGGSAIVYDPLLGEFLEPSGASSESIALFAGSKTAGLISSGSLNVDDKQAFGLSLVLKL